MQITVGVPSYDHIKTETVLSLMNFVTTYQPFDVRFVFNPFISHEPLNIAWVAIGSDGTVAI